MSKCIVILIMLCFVVSNASISHFKSCASFCFNHPPDVVENSPNLLGCAKLCEDVNFRLRQHVKNHFLHVSSVLSEDASSATPVNLTVNFFRFEYSRNYPSIFLFNSTGLCYAFEFDNVKTECGLFIDSSFAPTITVTPDAASCNVYQWKKDTGPCYFSYRDCEDIPSNVSGIYWIVSQSSAVPVYCLFNGVKKYTVVQRRLNNKENFRKGWQEYVHGFGDLNENFWIGNNLLHDLTSHNNYTLRIEFQAFDGAQAYQEYYGFTVGNHNSKFSLYYNSTNGTAGDAFPSSGTKFTTQDQDNDNYLFNCAVSFKSGGWWYNNCHKGNPNGGYLGSGLTAYAEGINWNPFKDLYTSLKTVSMMLKRK